MQKSHPKVVNPRDIAGERKKTPTKPTTKKTKCPWLGRNKAKIMISLKIKICEQLVEIDTGMCDDHH